MPNLVVLLVKSYILSLKGAKRVEASCIPQASSYPRQACMCGWLYVQAVIQILVSVNFDVSWFIDSAFHVFLRCTEKHFFSTNVLFFYKNKADVEVFSLMNFQLSWKVFCCWRKTKRFHESCIMAAEKSRGHPSLGVVSHLRLRNTSD